jgi:hypothetical protein
MNSHDERVTTAPMRLRRSGSTGDLGIGKTTSTPSQSCGATSGRRARRAARHISGGPSHTSTGRSLGAVKEGLGSNRTRQGVHMPLAHITELRREAGAGHTGLGTCNHQPGAPAIFNNAFTGLVRSVLASPDVLYRRAYLAPPGRETGKAVRRLQPIPRTGKVAAP